MVQPEDQAVKTDKTSTPPADIDVSAHPSADEPAAPGLDASIPHLNGFHNETEDEKKVEGDGSGGAGDADVPRKRRRVDALSMDARSLGSSRQESPPWRSFAAEGPSSFMGDDGRRKSSRTNLLPLQLQPGADKRKTRAQHHAASRTNGLRRSTSVYYGPRSSRLASSANGTTRARRVSSAAANAKPTPAQLARPITPASTSQKKSMTPNKSPVSQRRRARIAEPEDGPPHRKRRELPSPRQGTRRSSRTNPALADNDEVKQEPDESPNSTMSLSPNSQRKLFLRFPGRLFPPPPPYVPGLRHPGERASKRQYASFEEWLEHDDPFTGEDDKRMTDEQARIEAKIRQRILDAQEPGGVIAEGARFRKADVKEREPDPLYGHWDHVVAHALHFRTLMERERKAHMRDAKVLAHACRAAWRERYASRYDEYYTSMREKTKEELEKEEQERVILRYRQIVRDIKDRWRLVGGEVMKIRQARWEEEQQLRGKQALDEMLDQSTQLLQQRRPRFSSELPSEMDSMDETPEPETPGPYHDIPDEELTVEELALKYEHLKNVGSEMSSDGGDEVDEDVEDSEANNDAEEVDDGEEPEAADSASVSRDVEPSDTQEATDDVFTETSTPMEQGTPAPSQPEEPVDDSKLDADALRKKYEALLSKPLDQIWEENGIVSDASGEESSDEESDSENEDEDNSSGSEAEEEDNDGGAPSNLLGFIPEDELRQLQQSRPSPTPSASQAEDEPASFQAEVDHRPPSPVSLGKEEKEDAQARTEETAALEGDEKPEVPADEAIPDSDVMEISTDHKSTGASPQVASTEETRQSSGPTRVPIPTLFRGQLREYQHDGLDWLAHLWHSGTNGILADEMGLGKTVQTIALLAHLADNGQWGPHLVVVPTSVILNWEMEFKKFLPGFKILTYYGDQKEREAKRVGWLDDNKWNVIITSYQLILNDAQAFKRRNWHYMVLDEAHNIKNFQTKRWQTLLTFKTNSRLLLTGTPLQNSIQELWSLLYFLMPGGEDGHGGFAGLENFISALNRPTNQILEQGKSSLDAAAQKAVKKLHEVLRPYLLRRLKADVEKQMPKKSEQIIWCKLSKRQRQLYDEFMGRADTKRTLASGNYMSIMNCLMSLRKVCNHPNLFETRQIVTSFAMPKSTVAEYEIKDLLVRRRFQQEADDRSFILNTLNLVLTKHESASDYHFKRSQRLRAEQPLADLVEVQTRRLKAHQNAAEQLDGSLKSAVAYIEAKQGESTLDHLKTCLDITRQRTAVCTRRGVHTFSSRNLPIYGQGLVDRLYLDLPHRLRSDKPKRRTDAAQWYLSSSDTLREVIPTISECSRACEDNVRLFGCIPPRVTVEPVRELTLSRRGASLARSELSAKPDPFFESRTKLAIAFPDKRLLQYDCGKLQRLAVLLRELQAGGHRALIFTQMTKVLDILESFLNFHGYRYLRLDGATSIEHRQLRTNRFNQDERIMVFILSSRSGGLGLNLTGADTVIFYDLDWNPAMDKQCQDRCHRIGQTRDVTIYRLVSEYTIETNILKKSNAKRELDDVIIQEGDFTTDYLNRHFYKEVATEASEAMDRVLGQAAGLGNAFQGAEDAEDSAALVKAQKEIVEEVQDDERDFQESVQASGIATPAEKEGKVFRPGVDEEGEKRHVDDYMVELLDWDWRHIPHIPPKKKVIVKKPNKKARIV